MNSKGDFPAANTRNQSQSANLSTSQSTKNFEATNDKVTDTTRVTKTKKEKKKSGVVSKRKNQVKSVASSLISSFFGKNNTQGKCPVGCVKGIGNNPYLRTCNKSGKVYSTNLSITIPKTSHSPCTSIVQHYPGANTNDNSCVTPVPTLNNDNAELIVSEPHLHLDHTIDSDQSRELQLEDKDQLWIGANCVYKSKDMLRSMPFEANDQTVTAVHTTPSVQSVTMSYSTVVQGPSRQTGIKDVLCNLPATPVLSTASVVTQSVKGSISSPQIMGTQLIQQASNSVCHTTLPKSAHYIDLQQCISTTKHQLHGFA